jgi:hypothetical protein
VCHLPPLPTPPPALQGKELERKLAERRAVAGLEACTFSPQLTKRGQAVKRPGSAVDRLYRPDWIKERKREERKCVRPGKGAWGPRQMQRCRRCSDGRVC